MNVSVSSFTCVIACKTLTSSPATRPNTSTGAASTIAISSAPRPIPVTVSMSITRLPSSEALDERAHEDVPTVHQHEEHQLERERDQDGRQHHHAHRRQDRGHDEVEHQER